MPARGSWAAVAADAARASAKAAGTVLPVLPPRIQTAHGLGTASWFAQDVVSDPLVVDNGVQAALAGAPADWSGQRPQNGHVAPQQGGVPDLGRGLPLELAEQVLQSYAVDLGASQSTVQDDVQLPQLAEQQRQVATPAGLYSFRVVEPCHRGPPALGARDERPLLLFLHGFLGAAEDWQPVMQALCTRCRCLALDLPGHGQTRVRPGHSGAGMRDSTWESLIPSSADAASWTSDACSSASALRLSALMGKHQAAGRQACTSSHHECYARAGEDAFSLPAVAAAVASLVSSLQLQGAILVGYSLGARLALLLGTDYGHLFRQVVSISGTAGLLGEDICSCHACVWSSELLSLIQLCPPGLGTLANGP